MAVQLLQLLTVSAVKGVPPPTAPVIVILPAVPPRKVRVCAPSIVVLKLMSFPAAVPPELVVSKISAAASTVVPVTMIEPPAVVILLPMETPYRPVPAPLAVPVKAMFPVFVIAPSSLMPRSSLPLPEAVAVIVKVLGEVVIQFEAI